MNIGEAFTRLRSAMGRVFIGRDEVFELLGVALFAGGHVLIEDIPGVGKTLLARTLADCLGCRFRRVQFTPDLMPADLTGFYVYNPKTGEFDLREGPVATNILLADEINRAVPRTQAALLECMEERQVTVDGTTIPLPEPFLVLATQNPVEMEGTFPLPEAQMDRFMIRLAVGYPSPEEEDRMLVTHGHGRPERPAAVLTAGEVRRLQGVCGELYVSPAVRSYLLSLAEATRKHPEVALGASPRAVLALYRAAQALAALRGREFVLPDDVKRLAVPVLAHRLVLGKRAVLRGMTAVRVIEELLAELPVPVEGVD